MGIILVLVGIPLVLRWVPPNRVFGYRMPYAFSSDEAWYRANVLQGKLAIVAGLLSIPLDLLVVQLFDRRMASVLSVVILCGALLMSFLATWLVLHREQRGLSERH